MPHAEDTLRPSPDFDAVYRADPDPWSVTTSWYERRKRQIVLGCLTRQRYARGWDAASGTGTLTAELARRCDQMLASDSAPTAVELTRAACADHAHVDVQRVTLPREVARLRHTEFDLVVLSEFLYYIEDESRVRTVRRAAELCRSTAEIVVVHWAHLPDDAWLSGAEANAEAVAQLDGCGFRRVVHHQDADFVLDVVVRGEGVPAGDSA